MEKALYKCTTLPFTNNSRIIYMKSATSETIKFGRFELLRLVSNIRQRQSNIRQKFNWCFKRRIFHAPNTMHKICLFTWSRQTGFSALSTQMPRAESQVFCESSSWRPQALRAILASKLRNILVLTAAHIVVSL